MSVFSVTHIYVNKLYSHIRVYTVKVHYTMTYKLRLSFNSKRVFLYEYFRVERTHPNFEANPLVEVASDILSYLP